MEGARATTRRRTTAVAALFLAALATGCTSEPREGVEVGARAERCPLFDHEHAAWTELLDEYVDDGVVSYTRLHEEGPREARGLPALTRVGVQRPLPVMEPRAGARVLYRESSAGAPRPRLKPAAINACERAREELGP